MQHQSATDSRGMHYCIPHNVGIQTLSGTGTNPRGDLESYEMVHLAVESAKELGIVNSYWQQPSSSVSALATKGHVSLHRTVHKASQPSDSRTNSGRMQLHLAPPQYIVFQSIGIAKLEFSIVVGNLRCIQGKSASCTLLSLWFLGLQ